MWHHPCRRCKYTASLDIQKLAIKDIHSCRITYIKAIIYKIDHQSIYRFVYRYIDRQIDRYAHGELSTVYLLGRPARSSNHQLPHTGPLISNRPWSCCIEQWPALRIKSLNTDD